MSTFVKLVIASVALLAGVMTVMGLIDGLDIINPQEKEVEMKVQIVNCLAVEESSELIFIDIYKVDIDSSENKVVLYRDGDRVFDASLENLDLTIFEYKKE